MQNMTPIMTHISKKAQAYRINSKSVFSLVKFLLSVFCIAMIFLLKGQFMPVNQAYSYISTTTSSIPALTGISFFSSFSSEF